MALWVELAPNSASIKFSVSVSFSGAVVATQWSVYIRVSISMLNSYRAANNNVQIVNPILPVSVVWVDSGELLILRPWRHNSAFTDIRGD